MTKILQIHAAQQSFIPEPPLLVANRSNLLTT
jgi:hypothetical protein